MQIDPRVKSKPVYQPVEIDKSVQQHLFIAQNSSLSEMHELIKTCTTGEKSYWIVGNDNSESIPEDTTFISNETFAETLGDLFAKLPVSSNLYVSGVTEAFIWDVYNIATKAGLADEQIKMFKPLSNERRLFCTHCYTITDGVTQSPFECPGCHRLLLVRDHFSTIHAAYVGVQINAEDPNETHPIEELN